MWNVISPSCRKKHAWEIPSYTWSWLMFWPDLVFIENTSGPTLHSLKKSVRSKHYWWWWLGLMACPASEGYMTPVTYLLAWGAGQELNSELPTVLKRRWACWTMVSNVQFSLKAQVKWGKNGTTVPQEALLGLASNILGLGLETIVLEDKSQPSQDSEARVPVKREFYETWWE